MLKKLILSLVLLTSTLSLSHADNNTKSFAQSGKASWYGPGFHGKKTASGERFNMHSLVAAHRTLPFGSKLKVTCSQTGKSVIVTVTDRGPFTRKNGHYDRILDLSKGAAKELGFIQKGVGSVKIEKID